MAAFGELGLMPEICAGLDEMDWLLPTDVQQEAVPMILGGWLACVIVIICNLWVKFFKLCPFILKYN